MAILTLLVIATLIITGVYVGYHVYEASLHKDVVEHSIGIEIESFQQNLVQILSAPKLTFDQ